MARAWTLQSLRGGQWTDFATGDPDACLRHIAANAAGVWRAVNVTGQVVAPPRDVDTWLAANGHLLLPAVRLGDDEFGLPTYAAPMHSPVCPCGRAK